MHRPQFSIRTLLWLTLVVAAFFTGMAWQHRLASMELIKREQELHARQQELKMNERQIRSMYRRVLEKREFLRRYIERTEKRLRTQP